MRDIAGDFESGSFAYVDLNIDNYPSSLTGRLNNNTLTFLESLCSSFSFKTAQQSGDAVLYIPSGSQNSLAYLINLIDRYFYEFGNIAENIEEALYPYSSYNNYDYYSDGMVEEAVEGEVSYY